jgi:hypothetical protein
VSGVAVKSPPATESESDATTHELERSAGDSPAPPSATAAEDDEDRRETLLRENPFVRRTAVVDPPPAMAGAAVTLRSQGSETPVEVALARKKSSRLGAVLALVGALLLVAGAGLLALRLVQLRSEAASVAPPPAESSEPAISLGISRTASAAPASPSGPKTKAEAPTRSGSAPANDCDTPFTVDARGVRHPKPHCTKR